MDYRVSDFFKSQQFINNLAYTHNKLIELNQDISTGKTLRAPHDDSKNIGLALKYRTMITETDQFKQNTQYSFQWLTTVESHIRDVVNQMNSAKELGVRGANEPLDNYSRSVLAANVDQILKSVVDEVNSKYDGKYVFSKTQTQVQSLTATDSNGDGYIDTFKSIEERGVPSQDMKKEIGRGMYADIGYSAKTVFEDTGVLKSLVTLRDGLLNNNNAAIRSALDDINGSTAKLRGIQSGVGQKAQRAQDNISVLNSFKEQLQGMSSSLEDTDMAKAITQLNNWQVIYQASLQSTAKISKLSLVNFL